jgi:hypothetical protein
MVATMRWCGLLVCSKRTALHTSTSGPVKATWVAGLVPRTNAGLIPDVAPVGGLEQWVVRVVVGLTPPGYGNVARSAGCAGTDVIADLGLTPIGPGAYATRLYDVARSAGCWGTGVMTGLGLTPPILGLTPPGYMMAPAPRAAAPSA